MPPSAKSAARRAGARTGRAPYVPSRALAAPLPLFALDLPDAPTPLVAYPGLIRTECRTEGPHSGLNVEQIPAPGDTRALPTPVFPPEVCLHLFDYSVLLSTDRFVREVSARPDFQRPMSSAEYHYLLGG